jgi:predicted AAA+ superfamily ATPase
VEYRVQYGECKRLLLDRVQEPAPGRIQLVAGPRQVGKTTLLLELARELGERKASYVPCDAPEAALPQFWERTWAAIERAARDRGPIVLLLDEVQHLPDWTKRLKPQWDRLRCEDIPVHVVATGSSALRLGRSSRETLAGRFERLELVHWNAAEVARLLDVEPRQAAELVVR